MEDLPSEETIARYHHASLGYPVKTKLLKVVNNGN